MATADGWRPTNDAARGRVRRPVERRQVVAAQPARASQGVRAREQHAGPHARDQLLQGQRRSSCSSTCRATATRASRRSARREWRPLIEGYLRAVPALRGVVQLLDVRHDPTDDDLQMLDFLAELGVPTIVVLTKIDKLRRARAARSGCDEIAESLRLDDGPDDPVQRRDGRRARRARRGGDVAGLAGGRSR